MYTLKVKGAVNCYGVLVKEAKKKRRLVTERWRNNGLATLSWQSQGSPGESSIDLEQKISDICQSEGKEREEKREDEREREREPFLLQLVRKLAARMEKQIVKLNRNALI